MPNAGARRLPLTTKLATINAVMIASLVAVLVVALRMLPAGFGTSSELAQLGQAQRINQNIDMLHDALHADVLSALLLGDVPDVGADAVATALRDDIKEFRSELARLSQIVLSDVLRNRILQTQEEAAEYLGLSESTGRLALSNRAAALRQMPQFNTAFAATKQALAAQTEALAAALDGAHQSAETANTQARLWLMLAASMAIFIGWASVRSIGQSIRRSLTALRDVAHDVADGQLDRRSDLAGDDEVGQLASSVNRMAENLKGMIDRMRVDADRGTYGAELSQALDMADSETEAYQVVARAMPRVSTEHAMELLIADASDAHLERAADHPTAGASGCSVKASFGCIAVRRGHAIAFPDSTALNACPRLRERAAGAQSAACVPVTFMGRALGVLHASGSAARPLTEIELDRLTTLGVQAGGRIGTVRAFERTQLQASTDSLTGLPNRRSVEQGLRRLGLGGRSFTLVMCDLDHFKRLNDTHGHQAGDDALRTFAEVVRACTRGHDIAGRWGGEEFVFVLVDADPGQAMQWTVRVRDLLARTLQDRGKPSFTASFGLVDSRSAATTESLVRLSDIALYRAKTEGRNRAVLATADAISAMDDPALERRKSEGTAAVDREMLSHEA